MTKMKILVTGGTGFVGSHLIELLSHKGYELYVLVREGASLARLQRFKSAIHFVDRNGLHSAFSNDLDAVIHLATSYGRGNSNFFSSIAKSNILLGLKLLDLCIQHNVGLFINTDSFFNDARYNNTYLKSYTLSKKQFIEWLHVAKETLNIANMKLHHVYGPFDNETKFIPWLINEIQTQKTVDLTSGEQFRDFVYIDDVVAAYEFVLEHHPRAKPGFKEYVVSSGVKTTVRDFCEKLHKRITQVNGRANANLRFGKKIEPNEIYDVYNENANLTHLGWEPKFSLDMGIEKLLTPPLQKK